MDKMTRSLMSMQILAWLAVIVVVLLMLMTACLPSTPMTPDDPNPHVAFIGDSLTAGTDGRTDPGKPWWQYVGEHVNASRMDENARPGWTSTNALLAGKPAGDLDIVFIALGSNDQVAYVDPFTYRANLMQMADWGDQCFIIAPWQRTGFAALTLPPDAAPLLQYDLHAKYVADTKGCGFVDWSNLSSEGLTWDGLHPTPVGSQQLANLVIGAVK